MNKKLLPLFGSLLLCAACEITVTETEPSNPSGDPLPQESILDRLPTDYFIKDVMAYTWASGAGQATVYSSTCKEVDYKLVWKADNQKEYVVTFFDYPSRDSVEMMIGAASFGMYYDADLTNPYPAGRLYQADQINKNSINGFVIGYDTYTNVGFINTACPVEDLDIADEILDFLKINGGDRVTYDCNTVNAAGVEIKLVSNKPTTVSYSVSYEGNKCDLTETLRFAYYEEDCNAAYEDFKDDAEADPTLTFNMDDYSYSLETESLRCLDNLLDDFFMDAPLFKGKNVQKRTGKEFGKFLAGMSKKIRK